MANVFVNHNRKTCIVYANIDGLVRAVAMDSPELGLLEMGYEQFHSEWTEIGADDKKAASQYLGGLIPFNPEVQSILESIIMATKPKAKAPAKTETTAATDAATTAAPPTKGKKAPTDKTSEFFKGAAEKLKAKNDAADAKAAAKEGKTTAAAAAKAPKEPKEKAARAPKEDISAKKIKLLPAAEGKRFQEGSVRSQVFALIKDGMTVKALLAAVAKKEVCEEKVAIDCLNKLRDTNQKTPTVTLE